MLEQDESGDPHPYLSTSNFNLLPCEYPSAQWPQYATMSHCEI